MHSARCSGERCGEGLEVFPNGTRYVAIRTRLCKCRVEIQFLGSVGGDREAEMCHRSGCTRYPELSFRRCCGNRYVGHFENDTRTGMGTLKFCSGSVYEGQFADGNSADGTLCAELPVPSRSLLRPSLRVPLCGTPQQHACVRHVALCRTQLFVKGRPHPQLHALICTLCLGGESLLRSSARHAVRARDPRLSRGGYF